MIMIKQIQYDRFFKIETTQGTEWIPQDVIGKQSTLTANEAQPYIEGKFISASLVDGYGARLTMPGYLDCTSWTVFETEADAHEYLNHYYDEPSYDEPYDLMSDDSYMYDDEDPCADL
jgi:hypothetical protein